jgi:hypothetical protein
LPKANVREFDLAIADLKSRIAKRHADMEKQLGRPEVQPLEFHDGVARLNGWQIFDEPVGGVMKEIRSNDGKAELYIRAGPRTAASWRAKVRLVPGRYRFEGVARTVGIQTLEFDKQHGAALRVWGQAQARSEAAPANSRGESLRVEFDVAAAQDVELGCELRARAGEVWFDAASLRLVPVAREASTRGQDVRAPVRR